MNKAVVAALIILSLIGIFALGFYAVSIYLSKILHKQMENLHRKQTIAENVQVSSEWTEINLQNPLKPMNGFQKILLSIENFDDEYEDSFPVLKLQDSTIINPEVEISDDNGKIYNLKHSSIHNDSVSFLNPKKIAIKTIRIRSSNPFLCKKIVWYDYEMK